MRARIRRAFGEALHLVAITAGVGVMAGIVGAIVGATHGWNVLRSAAIAVGATGGIALALGLIAPLTLTSSTMSWYSKGGPTYDAVGDEPGGARMDAILLAASIVLFALAVLLYLLSRLAG